ncbi:MAG: methylenetetrahydrofolate reductase C-terminal domain-containing protein, partial [Syntrophomonadaceae bacterium]
MGNLFQDSLLNLDTFSVTWELVPGRGAREKAQIDALRSAEEAARDGLVHALTITDNPGGRPALSASFLGLEILQLGIEPLVHFTCKDKNRNQIESELYALDRAGVCNLLVMSGDYPTDGFKGRAKPVFDLDPVHVLEMAAAMNQGWKATTPQGQVVHQPSQFLAGAVVSPFKATEAELMVQYYKLQKKIAAGAGFVVTQLGYEARKFHEALQYIRNCDPGLPVIGNIYILPYGVARMMNANQLPGCVVTDPLLAWIDRERNHQDKGLEARLLRAAKMYAFMKGMGFDGVHLGGHNLKYEQVRYVIEKGEELTPDWLQIIPEFDFPQPDGFYYYEKDSATGLNTPAPVNRAGRPADYPVTLNHRLMRLVHRLAFTPGKNLFPTAQRYYSHIDDPSRHRWEHLVKVIGNDCQDCGDCALLDMAYLCPMSQCPKNQRNGACGGSRDGWCEVFPGKKKCV